jgi:hypothetical protein
VADRWFSPGPPVASTNKTDRHDITEILLKVALNTIKQTNNNYIAENTKIASMSTSLCKGKKQIVMQKTE